MRRPDRTTSPADLLPLFSGSTTTSTDRPRPRTPPGVCRFCVTGNSGGSSQVAYALAFYGLDYLVAALIPTGGPPHAAIAKGCGDDSRHSAYHFDRGSARTLDESWGFLDGNGPCEWHDLSWAARWQAASVAAGPDFAYPATRVRIIVGAHDDTIAPADARDYLGRVQQGQALSTDLVVVPGTPHPVQSTQAGLDAIRAAILGSH